MSKYREENIVGVRFGRLVPTHEHDGRSPSIRKYVCRCDCGKDKRIAACSLISGVTKSCGCLHMEKVTTHGHSLNQKQSPTYSSWVAMISRCTNAGNVAYPYYGGRGVSVCASWRESFVTFLLDMGERPDGMTIDRIDGALVYSKETCRWSTKREQVENRSNTLRVMYEGVLMPLKRACELTGTLYVTIRGRLARGVTGDALFSTHNLKRITK